MRLIAAVFCMLLLLASLNACAKKPAPTPQTPPSPPVDPYIGDNDETYVPMNYYY